ncbi:unnamed protein product, partial [Discosporangium mesarthrocarpum]
MALESRPLLDSWVLLKVSDVHECINGGITATKSLRSGHSDVIWGTVRSLDGSRTPSRDLVFKIAARGTLELEYYMVSRTLHNVPNVVRHEEYFRAGSHGQESDIIVMEPQGECLCTKYKVSPNKLEAVITNRAGLDQGLLNALPCGAAKILCSLFHMHELSIAHLDVKLSNIVVKEEELSGG